jgi:hypothetical protein
VRCSHNTWVTVSPKVNMRGGYDVQIGQRREIVNTGLAAGNHDVTGGPSLTANDRQQIVAGRRAPLIALFGFSEDTK